MSVDVAAKRPDELANSKPPVAIVDTDVHHAYRSKTEIYPYLSKTYKERAEEYGFGGGGGYQYNGGFRGHRVDLIDPANPPADSGAAASDVGQTQVELLGRAGVDIAILTGGPVYSATGLADVDYGSAICRAFNDFTIEHWLSKDSRFRYAMAINPQDPASAVKEINRIGNLPGIVAILLPCGTPRPYGQRFYHPIFNACSEHNLTVALHFGGEGSGINPPPTAAGYPSYYIEGRLARPSFYQVHLASFIFEGVFESYPTLKMAMLEGGFAWVPPFLWRADLDWKGLRHQTPWVRRLPSEYVLEHVRFGSQPVEEPGSQSDFEVLIKWMHGKTTLMFASDYPHWDWDDPSRTFTALSPELRQRIFADNACETFRLTS